MPTGNLNLSPLIIRHSLLHPSAKSIERDLETVKNLPSKFNFPTSRNRFNQTFPTCPSSSEVQPCYRPDCTSKTPLRSCEANSKTSATIFVKRMRRDGSART